MDKHAFENFEFLSATSEPGQFLLVHDDGTFTVNKSGGQFVTEEDSDQCLYDVTQSQFFVDVNHPSTGLVNIPDCFILPGASTSANDLYDSKDVVMQSAPALSTIAGSNQEELDSIQTTSCTEITLSDEQYNLLEKNGWVLLETSDKVFMLDSSGLHDITANLALTQQLKTEVQNDGDSESKTQSLRSVLNTSKPMETGILQENSQTRAPQEDTIELVFENESVEVEPTANVSGNIGNTHINEISAECVLEPVSQSMKWRPTEKKIKGSKQGKSAGKPPLCKPLKLKTQYCFTDIPEKIFLGKTVNGKKLVAKVTAIIADSSSKLAKNLIEDLSRDESRNKSCEKLPNVAVRPKLLSKKIAWHNASHLKNLPMSRGRPMPSEDEGGEKLFIQALEGASNQLSSKNMAAAKTMALQIMQIPTLLPMIENANLVVTKVVKSPDRSCLETCVMTGGITTDSCPEFVHMPNLIQDIRDKAVMAKDQNAMKADEDFSVLHIHIAETKFKDQEDAISIVLNKRSLHAYEQQLKNLACGTGAAVCNTKDELTDNERLQFTTLSNGRAHTRSHENIKLILRNEDGTVSEATLMDK